jgi:hypothetical protein
MDQMDHMIIPIYEAYKWSYNVTESGLFPKIIIANWPAKEAYERLNRDALGAASGGPPLHLHSCRSRLHPHLPPQSTTPAAAAADACPFSCSPPPLSPPPGVVGFPISCPGSWGGPGWGHGGRCNKSQCVIAAPQNSYLCSEIPISSFPL